METGQHETPHGHTRVTSMAPHSFLCSKKSSAEALPTSQKGTRSPVNVPHVVCQQFHISILQPGEGWPHLTPLLEADNNRPLESCTEAEKGKPEGTMAGSAFCPSGNCHRNMGIPSLPFNKPGLEISVCCLTSVLTQEKIPWDMLGFPPHACWDIPMSIESHSEVTL